MKKLKKDTTKSDEMKPVITLYAIRLSWIFMYLYLFIISLYSYIKLKIIGIHFVLFVLQGMIYLLANYALKRKTDKENSKVMIFFYILAVLLFALCLYVTFTH